MPTLLAILAHPDDESLGFGGTLATYAARGVRVALVTATRGERGRFRGVRPGEDGHPGADALGALREEELRAAAAALGVSDVTLLDYPDQGLDQAEPGRAVAEVAAHVRRLRPEVVLTFGADGAYGHPDHIAVSQLTGAAVVAAADAALASDADGRPHRVSKLYHLAWPASTWHAYQQAFTVLTSTVDGVTRQAVPWPEWAISATIEARAVADTVWRAVQCHASQVSAYGALRRLSDDQRVELLAQQHFCRAFSSVNIGRRLETDLFEGIPG